VVIAADCFIKTNALSEREEMNLKKAGIITLTASSLVIPFVLAQQGSSTPDTFVQDVRGGPRGGERSHGGFGEVRGMGVPLRGLELGSTATITFYDGDPATGGAALNTLTFSAGEDSEVAFAEQFEAARANAAYMQVEVSEQTRTINLSEVADDGRGPGVGRMLGRLNDGSTVTAAFYNTDPEAAGATPTQTLTFTQSSSSEAGFAEEFATAAEAAQFVTITTSPQSYTVNLSDMPNGPDFRGRGPRGDFDPRQGGPNQDGLNQTEPSQVEPSEVAPGESS
jgi:hypothetical protein